MWNYEKVSLQNQSYQFLINFIW